MAQGRNLTVYLTSDVSKFGRGLKQAESKFDKFRKGIAAGAAAAAAGLAVVGAAAIEAAKAAAEDQSSQQKLARAMQNTTKATEDQVAAMEDYVSAAQRKTGLDDGALREGLSVLMRYTKNATRAQALSNVAQKISLATGKDYLTVVKALARAEDGQTTALKKLGIPVGEAAQNYADLAKANKAYADAQAKANQVLAEYGPTSDEYAKALGRVKDAGDKVARLKGGGTKWLAELNDQFKGSIADDAKTYAGGLRRVGTAWDELVEAFGEGLIGGTDAPGQMSDLASSMYEAQPAAEALGQTLNQVLVPAMVDFVKGLAAIGPYWDTFVQTVSGGVTSVGDFLGVIPDDVAASMQKQYEQQIGRNNAQLEAIARGGQPTPVNPYDVYRPMATAQRTRTANRGADARAAQREARTRAYP